MKNLARTPVLVLDCQATGANPQKGFLLEIGWVVTAAAESETPRPEVHCSRPPKDASMPRQVEKVTGIKLEDLANGKTQKEIWRRLVRALKTASDPGLAWCPVLVHFARFEKSFLDDLRQRFATRKTPRFQLICTHEICKRLLPDLPRRGLRAVAGYLGHSVPEERRSEHHVAATAAIWRALVERLRSCNVETLDHLSEWLSATEGATRCGREYPMDRDRRLSLPASPGVYRLRRSNGDLLYVGKAISLKRRVNSYFQKRVRHSDRTLEMLAQARRIDVTVTPSALEAALMESDEIKRSSPPYNVALRKRDRQLLFASSDLMSVSDCPDATFKFGPFAFANTIEPLTRLAALVAGRDLRNGSVLKNSTLLDLPRRNAPDAETMKEGLRAFCDCHRLRHGATPARRLLRTGSLLWARHKNAQAVDDSEEADEPLLDVEEDALRWTPEQVARFLESVLLHCTRAVRKARWLCWLSESTIAWNSNRASTKGRKFVRFENGALTDRGAVKRERPPPPPPGESKNLLARQLSLDLMAVDRLNVLTTELRRLLISDRGVQVVLRKGTCLAGESLRRTLEWI